jgi:hypothetical protein
LSSLAGTWHNQLGSQLTIEVDGAGRISGHFTSATGPVAGAAYPVAGTYDADAPGELAVLGFVVGWTEIHAVTAWVGQYHRGEETIRATWLMTTDTEVGDEWRSTFVGHDVFHRGTDVVADGGFRPSREEGRHW